MAIAWLTWAAWKLDATAMSAFISIIAMFALILTLSILLLDAYCRRRYQRQTSVRRRRLEQFGSAPDAIDRFPHRLAELALHSVPLKRRYVAEITEGLPPGTVIIVNLPRQLEPIRPPARSVPFEPIELLVDHERAGWLAVHARNAEVGAFAKHDVGGMAAASDGERKASPSRWQRIGLVFAGVLVLAVAGGLGYALSREGTCGVALLLILGPALVLAVTHWLFSLLMSHEWWLVPGALVHARHVLWRRMPRVDLFYAAQSVLIIDLGEGGAGLVCSAGRAGAFPVLDEENGQGIVAGWLSEAHAPTEQELRSFINVGPEG